MSYIDNLSVTVSTLSSASYSSTSSFLIGNATASLFGTASWASNITSSGITGNISSSTIVGNLNTTASWSTNTISASVNATVPGPYYFDLSSGSSGNQPTYVSTALVFYPAINTLSGSSLSLTASLSGAHSGPSTGSVFGTSSAAVIANTSSFGTGIPQIQCGTVTGLSTATTTVITFNKAFPNTSYAVAVTPSGSAGITGSRWSAKTVGGFTMSFSSFTGQLDWMAISNT